MRGGATLRHKALAMQGYKDCAGCEQALPISNFGRHMKSATKLRARCRSCEKAARSCPAAKARHALAQAKYKKTAKGKAVDARYFRSDKAKANAKKWRSENLEVADKDSLRPRDILRPDEGERWAVSLIAARKRAKEKFKRLTRQDDEMMATMHSIAIGLRLRKRSGQSQSCQPETCGKENTWNAASFKPIRARLASRSCIRRGSCEWRGKLNSLASKLRRRRMP